MPSEESVVRRAIEADSQAFAQLYDEHFDKIYRYIYLKVGDRGEAEDLTQQVFLKALEAIGRYKWRSIPFSAWLFRIARNQVIDYLRKRTRQMTMVLDERIVSDGTDPVVVTERRLEVQELLANLEKLSPAQREVIYLRFIAEFPIAEVAKTLGKSEGAVKALQYNAVVALRKLFFREENE